MSESEYTCHGCGQTKLLSEFYRRSNTRGHYTRCKPCHLEYNKRRRRERSDHVHALEALYSQRHAEYKHQWYLANRDKQRVDAHARYLANRDAKKAAVARWRQLNPEKLRIYAVNYDARKANASGVIDSALVRQMHEDQGRMCAYCEAPLLSEFHVEHMQPLSRGGTNEWANIAISCATCNLRKNRKTVEEFWDVLRCEAKTS